MHDSSGVRRRFQALFAVQFVSSSGFVVYRTVYLGDLGLTGGEVGLAGAALVLTGVLAQPVWGALTDRYGRERLVLAGGATTAAVGLLAYPVAVHTPAPFLVVLAGTLVFAAARAPIVPLTNAMVLGAGLRYGSIRALGSVAFGVGAVAFGGLVGALGVPVVVYAYVAGLAAFAAIALSLPDRRVREAAGDDADPAAANGDGATPEAATNPFAILRNPAFLGVLAVAFLSGTVLRGAISFFAVYARDAGVAGFGMEPATLAGVAWAVKTAFEAVGFVYADQFVDERTLLWGGAALVAVAPAAYWLTDAALVVLAVQAVAGLGFAGVSLAAVLLTDDATDPRRRGTAQTLLAAVGFGAGGALGQAVAGGLVDAVGVREMYGVFAGVAVCAALVALALAAAARR